MRRSSRAGALLVPAAALLAVAGTPRGLGPSRVMGEAALRACTAWARTPPDPTDHRTIRPRASRAGPKSQETTMRFRRLVLLAAAPLALATLLGSPASAHDISVRSNALNSNGIAKNALNSNALATTGSALDDLDGVAVEAVTLPDEAR